MIGTCPYPCKNKTEFGYCRNTGCINPVYMQIIFYSHNQNTFPTPCSGCRNNPANGGSGICHCTLGTPKIT